MLLTCPIEITHFIVKQSSRAAQASLALTNRALHAICNPLLYENDAVSGNSFAIFYSILYYKNQTTVIRTLELASFAGSNLHEARLYREAAPQLFIGIQAPIALAAMRGLDDVVLFLLDYGVSPNGPCNAPMPPFWGALLAGQGGTALKLAKYGASIKPIQGLNSLHIAIQAGLEELVHYLVTIRGIDINTESQSGITPIMMAVYARNRSLVRFLIDFGADIYASFYKICFESQFSTALSLLEAIDMHVHSSLQIQDVMDLIILVTTQKGRFERISKRNLVHKLLEISESILLQSSCPISAMEMKGFLGGLLQRMPSMDHVGDTDMAVLLLNYGITIQPGTSIELLGALGEFCKNKFGTMTHYPRLFKKFHTIYQYQLSQPPDRRDALTEYFLKKVPNEAKGFLGEILRRNLPLDIYGVRSVIGTPQIFNM